MANVDEFLEQNPSLDLGDSIPNNDISGVRIEGRIIGISAKYVKFSHMGTDYIVLKENVLDITERVDPIVPGNAVTLMLTRDASMLANYSVTAAELTSSLPFSLSRPSPVSTRRNTPSVREIAWRQAARYSSDYPSLEIYLSPYGTSTGSETATAGGVDDTGADDERADY
jgi:hypothetical protein